MTVDPSTGAVRLRAIFPNPDGLLLPGLYVRATINQGVNPRGILVPQQAMSRNEKGEPTALVVDAKNIARLRVLKTGRAIDGNWQVLDGLKPGDKMIVEGLQKAQPDMPVVPQIMEVKNQDGSFPFFIDRPVFAWVLAIVIMLTGGIAATQLPIEQYPTIAPPAVVVSAIYPGADAQTVQNSVTQVIEQQLTGLDNLLYFSSASNADGTAAITATFAPGTNPDIAQVQVQNKVQAAVPLLPSQVQQLGVVVAKNQPNFIIVVGIYDDTGRYNNVDISDFITSKMNDPAEPRARRGLDPGVRRAVCDTHLAGSLQAEEFRAAAFGCERRGAGPERPGVGGPDRPAADHAGHAVERHRHRPVAAADARTVPQDRPQDRSRRRGRAAARCRPRRAGRRFLCHHQPVQRPSRPPVSPSCWRRAPTR